MALKLYGVNATIIIFVFVLYCIVLYSTDPTGNQVNCRVVDGGSGAASIELVPFVVGGNLYKQIAFYPQKIRQPDCGAMQSVINIQY